MVMRIVMRVVLVTMMVVMRLLTSNEASDAALAVSVKLDAAGESCSDSSATVTNLSVCVLTQFPQKGQNWVVIAMLYLFKVILVLPVCLADLVGVFVCLSVCL